MNVRLDKGRDGQASGAVDDLLARVGGEVGGDLLKLPVGDADVDRLGPVFHKDVFDQHMMISFP